MREAAERALVASAWAWLLGGAVACVLLLGVDVPMPDQITVESVRAKEREESMLIGYAIAAALSGVTAWAACITGANVSRSTVR